MTTIAIFGLAISSIAQVPSYLPSNGLVGYWPFNGNANDLSGSSNNLNAVGNVSYSYDRFGNQNSAVEFYNASDYLTKSNPILPIGNTSRTLSMWIYSTGVLSNPDGACPFMYGDLLNGGCYKRFGYYLQNYSNSIYIFWHGKCNPVGFLPENIVQSWNHIVLKYESSTNYITLFQNGQILDSQLITNGNSTTLDELRIGSGLDASNPVGNLAPFDGKIDDVCFWNRALSEQEINNLYNATNCSNNLTILPATNQLQTGNTATFSATTSDANPSYVWQSDFGQGFQTLNNYGNYSGTNTNSLSISNVQLPNHTQPIRVISTSGECIDTSNVATINITDTCIVTINDTITTLISVTDTLVINTLITGLTPPNNSTTIKVFPNPANNHITIDFGNFASMNGYTLKITNSIGQTVFTTPVNQQSSYVDLSTWGGNGIYFVQIIDSQNNTIENRKIVLQ